MRAKAPGNREAIVKVSRLKEDMVEVNGTSRRKSHLGEMHGAALTDRHSRRISKHFLV